MPLGRLSVVDKRDKGFSKQDHRILQSCCWPLPPPLVVGAPAPPPPSSCLRPPDAVLSPFGVAAAAQWVALNYSFPCIPDSLPSNRVITSSPAISLKAAVALSTKLRTSSTASETIWLFLFSSMAAFLR